MRFVCLYVCMCERAHTEAAHSHTRAFADRLHRHFRFKSLDLESNPYVRPILLCWCVFFSLHFVGSHTGLVMKFPQIPMSYTLLQRTVYMSACMSSPHTHLKSTYFEWSNRISDLDGEAHAYFCILALWYSMVIAGWWEQERKRGWIDSDPEANLNVMEMDRGRVTVHSM